MGKYVRLSYRRGSSRPWVGTVVNKDTGDPIDLRQDNTRIELVAKVNKDAADPIFRKTYGIDLGPGGITVDPADPGNVYTVSFDPEDTESVKPNLLVFEVQVVEPDDESDTPVWGAIVLTGDLTTEN